MRRTVTLITAAAVLALPAPAAAKGVGTASLCGDDGECVKIGAAHLRGTDRAVLMQAAGPVDPPADVAPWYRLRVRVEPGPGEGEEFEPFTFTNVWVPSAGLMRGSGEHGPEWMTILPEAETILRRAARELDPLPAARLTGLDLRAPEAQVSEVLYPPEPAEAGGGAPQWWTWAGAAIALAGVIALAAVAARRFAGRRSVTVS